MPDVFTEKSSVFQKEAITSHDSPQRISIMNKKPHKVGLFTTFAPLPEGVTFETKEPEEQVLLLVRKHFITNVTWVLITLFLFLFSFFLFPFLRSDTFSEVLFIPDTYLIILSFFYYLILAGYVLQQFATWFYQIGLITNERIVDVDFHTLMSRNVAYTDIVDVVDVEIIQKGFLHNAFNYGTVQMQTEGMKANFEFIDIPDPHTVADVISDLMRHHRKGGSHA